MLYETERQKLSSNPSLPGWPRPAQGEVWRDVLSSPQKGDKLDKNEAGRGERVTLRHVTSSYVRQRQVKQNPWKYQTGHPATIRRVRNQLKERLNVQYSHMANAPKAAQTRLNALKKSVSSVTFLSWIDSERMFLGSWFPIFLDWRMFSAKLCRVGGDINFLWSFLTPLLGEEDYLVSI